MVSTLISGMFLDSESSLKLTDLVELTNSVSTRPHTDKAVLIVGQLTVDGFVEKHPVFTLNLRFGVDLSTFQIYSNVDVTYVEI